MSKPFSQACANNQHFILNHLERLLDDGCTVLEVGSGTGQHGVYFSQHLPEIVWQTSDLEINHQGIQLWLNEAKQKNCLPPITIDVALPHWSSHQYDTIFTANTLHICSWSQVILFFQHLTSVLKDNGLLIIYGPFKYAGEYTSESNAQFDKHLQSFGQGSGIRDIENIIALAKDNGLVSVEDQAMPANNRLLVFRKTNKGDKSFTV